MSDSPFDIERMISDMNRSMPVNRRSLSDYLEHGNLTYKTRDGAEGTLEAAELESLSAVCRESEAMKLKLPIFIGTDTSYPGGAWKVEGRTEAAVISRLLGKKIYKDDYLRIYYPDLKELRKILPNSTVVVFLP